MRNLSSWLSALILPMMRLPLRAELSRSLHAERSGVDESPSLKTRMFELLLE